MGQKQRWLCAVGFLYHNGSDFMLNSLPRTTKEKPLAYIFLSMNGRNSRKKQYRDLEALEYEEPTKEQILQELKEAVQELKLVEQGKLKARPAKELLNEL